MADEELQLKLEIDSKESEQLVESLELVQEEVKILETAFSDMTKTIEGVGTKFDSVLISAKESLGVAQEEAKKAAKDIDGVTNAQENAAEDMKESGKVMKAVWKDVGAGVGTLKGALTDLVGMKGLAVGGLSVTGGFIAALIGSFVTTDKIQTALQGVTTAAATMMGQFSDLDRELYKAEAIPQLTEQAIRLRKSFEGLGQEGVMQLMTGAARAGQEITELTDDTYEMSLAMDTALKVPFGTHLEKWGKDAKSFGKDLNDVSKEMLDLHYTFSAFVKDSDMAGLSVIDLTTSLELASRSLSGWRTNWQSMVEFQLEFVKMGRELGLSAEGGQKAFEGLVGAVGKLSDQDWMFILTNMEKTGVLSKEIVPGMPREDAYAEIKALYERGLGDYGTDAFGRIEAAKDVLKTLRKKEGGVGATGSVWLAELATSMMPTGMSKGVQIDWLEKMGIGNEAAKVLVRSQKELQEWLKSPKTEAEPAAMKEFRAAYVEQMKRERAAGMTLAEQIEAGIKRWWAAVAPALLGSLLGIVAILGTGFKVLMDWNNEDKRKDLMGSIDFTLKKLGDAAEITKKEYEASKERLGEKAVDLSLMFPPVFRKKVAREDVSTTGEDIVTGLMKEKGSEAAMGLLRTISPGAYAGAEAGARYAGAAVTQIKGILDALGNIRFTIDKETLAQGMAMIAEEAGGTTGMLAKDSK
jgi:hypothetical protein